MPEDWEDELYNYIVLGFNGGSFFMSLYANDNILAVSRKSHELSSMRSIRSIMGWLSNKAPAACWGSQDKIIAWMRLTTDQRREICEELNLLPTEKEEVWDILKEPIES